jgi:tetratricopeptide (TPR) repeat protein
MFFVYVGRRMRMSTDTAPLYSPPYTALAASAVLLGLYAVLRMTALRFAPPQSTGTEAGLATRMVEAMQSLALYFKLLFVPTGLHMERTLDGVSTWIAIVGFGLLALCVVTLLVAFRTGRHRIALAIGLFLITWFPISGLIPLNAPMAEHWMYVPMAGLWWALFEIVWTVMAATRARYALYALVYATCAMFVALTVNRNTDWRSNESLYSATLAKNPNTVRVRYNLAVTYEDLLGNLPAARREYEKVLDYYAKKKEAQRREGEAEQFWQDEIESHLSLAGIFLREEHYDKAAAHYTTLLRLNLNDDNAPVIAAALIGMAQTMTSTGRAQEAERLLDEGIQRIPQLKSQLEEAKQRILGLGLAG